MSLTLRNVKGSALTYQELDDNFNFLDINYGNVLFVSLNGDDSTAAKGKLTTAYSKLTTAAAAATSGDLIIVLPGRHEITDSDIAAIGTSTDATLFRDGVTWYFEPGAILKNAASETNPYRPFHCITDNQTCIVLGYMEYIGQEESINETYNGLFTPFNITANNVNFHFEVQDIDTGSHGGGLGEVVGDDINITVLCKGIWTHRAGTGWYNGGEGQTNRLSAVLDFNKIISIEDPNYGTDGYGTPIFYPTGTDSRISITVKDCYATETDGVASSQAREGQFLSTQYLTRSQLTIKCNNYRNDYSVAVNDAIIWLRTVDCDISIHFDSCIADKLYYGVISLYNQNSSAETAPSRIKITGSYVGVDKPCITDLGHYGSAAIRNDDQVKVHAHLRSENSEVIRMDRAAADFELSGEIRCDWDNIAGHGVVLDAAGANLRLRDLEIVCANASAKAIESNVGSITLLAYNTFSHTNPLGNDITLTAPAGFEFPQGGTIIDTGSFLTTGSSDSDVQNVNGSLKLTGDIIAENYIISSSILYQTQSFSSGSTVFGDSTDDTHLFTGSLDLTGSFNVVGPITADSGFEVDIDGQVSYYINTSVETNNNSTVSANVPLNSLKSGIIPIYFNNNSNSISYTLPSSGIQAGSNVKFLIRSTLGGAPKTGYSLNISTLTAEQYQLVSHNDGFFSDATTGIGAGGTYTLTEPQTGDYLDIHYDGSGWVINGMTNTPIASSSLA